MASGVTHIIANRYELQEVLGEGAMGVVHRAVDRLTLDEVALKMVQPPTVRGNALKTGNPATMNPLLTLAQEFRMSATLRHPNIVSVLDYGFSDLHPFYVMDYIEQSQSLTEAAVALPDDEKAELLLQLLSALHYLHRRDVLHRDLKPANVLVTNKQVLQVVDFGLAVLPEGLDKGEFVGTPAYMAPETIQYRIYSVRSELWAVGVMAFEIFTSRRPFIGNINAIMTQIMSEVPPYWLLDGHPIADWIANLLEEDPANRVQTAYEAMQSLCELMGWPPPRQSEAELQSFVSASKFVGRKQELAQLEERLRTAIAGETHFQLIGGTSGVGKSRLVEELRTIALVSGMQVLSGQAVEGAGLPFEVWRTSIIPQLLLYVTVDDRQAAILKEIVPDIAEMLGRPVPDAPPMSGSAAQERIVITIVDLFKRLEHPTLLVLEDLQWTKESLLPFQLMLQVQQQLSGLFVVATYRHDERADLPEHLPGVDEMELQSLTPETISDLIRAVLGEKFDSSDWLVDLLQERTQGNTLFMIEVVRALATEAGGVEQLNKQTLTQHLSGLTDMNALLKRRLENVLTVHVSMTKLAAVAGRRIDQNLMLAWMTPETLQAWLYSLERAYVLTVRDDVWRFSHDRLRDAIIHDLPQDELPTLHRQLAETYERVYPNNPAYNELLLDHWYHAGDLEKELRYLLPVAEQLITIKASYEEALALLARGLERSPADNPHRVALLTLRAEALERKGDLEDATHHAEQALQLARAYDDARGIAASRRILGHLARARGELEVALEHHEYSHGYHQAQGDVRRRATSLCDMAAIYGRQGRHKMAQDHFERALALSRSIDDQHGIASAMTSLAEVATDRSQHKTARLYYEKALPLYDGLGDPRGRGRILSAIGTSHNLQGRHSASHKYFQDALVTFEQIGSKFNIAVTYNNMAMALVQLRRYDEARDAFDESLALFDAIPNDFGSAVVSTELAFLSLRMGQPDALPQMQEALRAAIDLDAEPLLLYQLVGFAELRVQAGDALQATAWAGLIDAHPSTDADVRARLDELDARLRDAVAGDVYDAACARGKALDLMTVMRGLLPADA